MSTLIWLFDWWLIFVAIALPFLLLLSLCIGTGSSPGGVAERRSQAEIRQQAMNLKTRTIFWWL